MLSWSAYELSAEPHMNLFGHIPWEYLGQHMNFSADSPMWLIFTTELNKLMESDLF